MTKFSDLKLDPKVLQAVTEAGYETPTPIQVGAIPPALEGRDVLGIAQTGTGKTAGFVLPMITLLGRGRARARMPRSLVLCPTRELAAQVAENFDIYAKHTRLTKALLIGGVSFKEQDLLIDRGVDVLIATPGRLLDHFERGKLLLTGVQIMVVDEADRMLDMGFIPDIERIFQLTPFTRQTLFFSATMAPEIERITNTFLHAPERIEVARQATTSETITQKLVELTPTRKDQTSKQKRELLRAIIDGEGEALTNAIIFCNRKTDVDILAKSLKSHGYDAAPIHGDLDQSHRTRTLDGFRDGKLKLLIASDVAARGLDIPAVSHVFNFDLPSHAEDYVHRIGRTGRAGRKGTAISIGTPADEKLLSAIENLVKQALPRSPAPEGFTPTESTGPASRPRDDRKGGSRSGNGRRRRDDDRAPEPQPAESPAPQPQPAARREESRRDDSRSSRDTRHDQRRGRGRDDSRGPAIIGMGDHVPGFMLVELRPALASAETSDQADVTDDTPVAEAPAEAPTKAPRRSRRRKETTQSAPEAQPATEPAPGAEEAPAAEAAAAEVSVTEAPVAEAAAPEAPVQVTEAPAQPEPAAEVAPKPTRSRRKKVEPAPADAVSAAEAETPAETPAPKPRRSRAKKVETAPEAEAAAAEVAAEEAPAPKSTRTRRKKAEPEATAAEDAPADAPAPKPRRTRRKKTDTAEDSTTESPVTTPTDSTADSEA